MKRIALLVALLLCVTAAVAQNDSVDYSRPNRNPMYYFGSPFCTHFAELKLMAGLNDLGMGVEYTYLPEVWGFHLSAMDGTNAKWGLAGANYRLSDPWIEWDFQLFGSLGVRHGEDDNFMSDSYARCTRPALELGVRLAAADGWGSFGHTSFTISYLTDFTHDYLTLGLSVSIVAVLGSYLLYFY